MQPWKLARHFTGTQGELRLNHKQINPAEKRRRNRISALSGVSQWHSATPVPLVPKLCLVCSCFTFPRPLRAMLEGGRAGIAAGRAKVKFRRGQESGNQGLGAHPVLWQGLGHCPSLSQPGLVCLLHQLMQEKKPLTLSSISTLHLLLWGFQKR